MVRKYIILSVMMILFGVFVYGHSLDVIFEEPVLLFNNSVGKDWSFSYIINNTQYSLHSRVLIPIPQSPFSIQIISIEEDSIPDIGYSTIIVDPKELKPGEQYTYEIIVQVKENGGRYKGNEAQWKVRFTIDIKE
jgi:hypothetical protein